MTECVSSKIVPPGSTASCTNADRSIGADDLPTHGLTRRQGDSQTRYERDLPLPMPQCGWKRFHRIPPACASDLLLSEVVSRERMSLTDSATSGLRFSHDECSEQNGCVHTGPRPGKVCMERCESAVVWVRSRMTSRYKSGLTLFLRSATWVTPPSPSRLLQGQFVRPNSQKPPPHRCSKFGLSSPRRGQGLTLEYIGEVPADVRELGIRAKCPEKCRFETAWFQAFRPSRRLDS